MTMARIIFIQCSVPSAKVDGAVVANEPVNIYRCEQLRRDDYSRAGKAPSIHFAGTAAQWVFETETQRDQEFERLMIAYGHQGEVAQ
jgi:hypothetical protein